MVNRFGAKHLLPIHVLESQEQLQKPNEAKNNHHRRDRQEYPSPLHFNFGFYFHKRECRLIRVYFRPFLRVNEGIGVGSGELLGGVISATSNLQTA